ncbi:MAG: hypothetical protein A2X08_01505 [Bacteroidetes bacterium GWA2_32_17]|nr:MAG: hypothetical protein A2X08_01505 [Bacteroidetes bacterium GWA2_32_17]
MNTLELRRNFHLLIDSIDNENILIKFYELILNKKSEKENVLWNNLTNEQRRELNLAFEESEESKNLISNDELKKKHKKWL